MNKQQLKNVIEMLNAQWEMGEGFGEEYFLKYTEIACDRTNEETYILEDLQLLAEVLEEMEMTYMIKTIEIYDLPSAKKVEYLIAE